MPRRKTRYLATYNLAKSSRTRENNERVIGDLTLFHQQSGVTHYGGLVGDEHYTTSNLKRLEGLSDDEANQLVSTIRALPFVCASYLTKQEYEDEIIIPAAFDALREARAKRLDKLVSVAGKVRVTR